MELMDRLLLLLPLLLVFSITRAISPLIVGAAAAVRVACAACWHASLPCRGHRQSRIDQSLFSPVSSSAFLPPTAAENPANYRIIYRMTVAALLLLLRSKVTV